MADRIAQKGSSPRTGRPCKVCTSPDRDAIDRLLVAPGKNQQEIGRIFGIHPRNLSRHKDLHLSQLLKNVAATEYVEGEAARGKSLLDQIGGLRDRSMKILDQAEGTKSLDTALRAVREARGCIEVMAKLTGQIEQGTTVNIFQGPAWVAVQTNMIMALQDYPEAKERVLQALAIPA